MAKLPEKYIEHVKELHQYFEQRFVEFFDVKLEISDNPCIYCITSVDNFTMKLAAIKKDKKLEYCQLIDLFAVDYPYKQNRFEINYHLISLKNNIRVIIKIETDDKNSIPSVTSIFPVAGWYEREIWDMYGIKFKNNHDLRRILTDYNFQGHPLRKDFPLTGYTQVRYDDKLQKIVYEPVTLQQDYRDFDFLSPWEGAKYILPGDEKAS